MTPTVVGTITVGEGETHRETYEVAAWNTDIALTPGVYEVTASAPRSYVDFAARVPGVITESYTPALFGGVVVGTQPQGAKHRDVGQEREVYLRVGLERITLNDLGRRTLARFWIVSPHFLDFSGPGLVTARQSQLVPVADIWHHNWRIDPNNGDLTEFTDDVSLLVERVNELQAAGFDPDVWRVQYGDDKKLWYEIPFEEHRSYNARKFNSPGRDNWRYYGPEYRPPRSS